MKIVLFLVALLGVGLAQKCDPTKCKGACRCMSTAIPGNIPVSNTPQFVTVTFDDAVNVVNYELYKSMFLVENKNPSQCNIGATFFVSHEYNNYAYLHQLWGAGSEIAVRTVSTEASTEFWKKATAQRWTDEVVGMRTLINKFSQIPAADIKGFRAPFLQTSGNVTFEVLHKEKFLYDNSMATSSKAGLGPNAQPIWPYTFDFKNPIDCVTRPCPTGLYSGLWEVPLVSHFKLRQMDEGKDPEMIPCSMADACLPLPETKEETYQYLMENFNRHYLKNRAPYPLCVHEPWLRAPGRKEGYMQFFKYLMDNKDVYIVPIQEVVEFIKDPKPIGQYKEKRCIPKSLPRKCNEAGLYCYYEDKDGGGSKVLYVCSGSCPEYYPTLGNWRDLE